MSVAPHLKVAVTGASGFIGRHVLSQLAGHPVAITAVTRDASRLAECSVPLNVVEMDISHADAGCFEELGRPDILLHLAWDGLPNYRSLHHFESEVSHQYRFLKAMIRGGLAALLVTGTCFEYGMQSGPLSEDMATRPDNPYGYAKNALRQQLGFLKTVQSFSLAWTRLFYMYGEGQPPNSLYPQLRDAVSRGERVFRMSGGEQLRDYLRVDEVARMIVALAVRRLDAGIVNICAGTPVSVRRLVEEWIRENNWDIQLGLGHYPYPDYESMAFWGDRSRLDSILNHHDVMT